MLLFSGETSLSVFFSPDPLLSYDYLSSASDYLIMGLFSDMHGDHIWSLVPGCLKSVDHHQNITVILGHGKFVLGLKISKMLPYCNLTTSDINYIFNQVSPVIFLLLKQSASVMTLHDTFIIPQRHRGVNGPDRQKFPSIFHRAFEELKTAIYFKLFNNV